MSRITDTETNQQIMAMIMIVAIYIIITHPGLARPVRPDRRRLHIFISVRLNRGRARSSKVGDGWMAAPGGWLDGWMDAWMDGEMEGWMVAGMHGCMACM